MYLCPTHLCQQLVTKIYLKREKKIEIEPAYRDDEKTKSFQTLYDNINILRLFMVCHELNWNCFNGCQVQKKLGNLFSDILKHFVT